MLGPFGSKPLPEPVLRWQCKHGYLQTRSLARETNHELPGVLADVPILEYVADRFQIFDVGPQTRVSF
jgi:hypothetical protein